MGKIALLVSHEEMLYQAHNILQEKQYEISQMKVIRTEEAVSEARRAKAEGVSVIIARGLQASLIRQYTDIPVAEIVITAQEMGLLITRAKQILKKPNPLIAVVGFKNMFCDMTYFDSIYEIRLRTFFAERAGELEEAAREAVRQGAQLVIGGDTAVEAAAKAGVPFLFLSMTEDSLRGAFLVAERMDYAMESQKRNRAQMETVLDNSFNGVARLDGEGRIVDANPIMADLLQRKKEDLLGSQASQVFRDLDRQILDRVLKEGGDPYSLFLKGNQAPMFAVVAPVVVEGKTEGAILTCHPMKASAPLQKEREGEKERRGKIWTAAAAFDRLTGRSGAMAECIRLAKLFALSEKPVMLWGEAGTEKRMLAQSIHNAGRGDGPFVEAGCDGGGGERGAEALFGERGAAVQARGGTLFIQDIEAMPRDAQYRLERLIRGRVRIDRDGTARPCPQVRVIVSAARGPRELLEEGLLRAELCYLLEGLNLRVPPFRERPEDLALTLDACMKECCRRYSRYHVLTGEAKKLLLSWPWRGNLYQIEGFCERLVLTAGKRSLDQEDVWRVLGEMGQTETGALAEADLPARRPQAGALPQEAMELRAALERLGGSREKTAKALGISKTTLWRKMKKYGLQG